MCTSQKCNQADSSVDVAGNWYVLPNSWYRESPRYTCLRTSRSLTEFVATRAAHYILGTSLLPTFHDRFIAIAHFDRHLIWAVNHQFYQRQRLKVHLGMIFVNHITADELFHGRFPRRSTSIDAFWDWTPCGRRLSIVAARRSAMDAPRVCAPTGGKWPSDRQPPPKVSRAIRKAKRLNI
jgi:hypothetical protein